MTRTQHRSVKTSRPHVPGYSIVGAKSGSGLLPWSWATERLVAARNYWIGTTRSDGYPHVRPVWGVWLDDAFYFSTGSLILRNLERDGRISVNLESGDEALMLEGVARPVSDRALVRRFVEAYNPKYQWDMSADEPPGPVYAVRPRVAFGWLCDNTGADGGSAYNGSATRWLFDE